MLTSRECRRTRSLVSLFPSGDLRRDEEILVREHLAACPACRRELRGFLDGAAALASATGPEEPPAGEPRPSGAFFDDLQERILTAVAAPRGRPWRRRLFGAVAAVAMFGVGLGIVGLALGDGGRPALLDVDPITSPSRALPTSGSWVRPVGLPVHTGLRGRAAADAMLLSMPDPLPETVPVPIREERSRR